jgi:hypothetical protein
MGTIAQRHDIRDFLPDGVEVVLARFGYGKMTVSDPARQVGIGKGANNGLIVSEGSHRRVCFAPRTART